MQLTVNGEPEQFDRPCTVTDLLERRGLSSAPCAVEVNSQLIPKRHHGDYELNDGDTVEIVTLVGGG